MDDQDRGSKCELKIWQDKVKKGGERETVSVSSLGGVAPDDAQFAVVVRQVFNDKNTLEKTVLTVNSPHLLQVFRDVVGSHPTVAADFSESFEMESPFQMLYHFWDELLARKDETANDDERMHLNLLFEFMEADMGPEKRTMDKAINSGQITFDTLWVLFRPGDLAVTYVKSHPWLLKVVKTAYEENKRLGPFLEVHCSFTDYDGTHVGESKKIFQIVQKLRFAQKNPSKILDLDVFPRKFLDEDNSLENSLAQRADKFLSMQGVSVQHCDGLAQYLEEPPPSYWHPDMEDFDLVWLNYTEVGRVIIDRETFQKDNYQQLVSPRPNLSDDDKILCPPFVYGFSTARQDWCRFYLSTLSEVPWRPQAFDSLILPEAQLRMIRALVSSHNFPAGGKNQSEQKGKGLVILLHGPPGAGKTLTAECAAEATHKALLSTSLHQLNKYNEAYYFEYRLQNILRLATIWKAVVLFDEADVFLEARGEQGSMGNGSASRNALVAIFLRHLEYFSGIVFLTTNRIGVFDAAMKSRLHLALGYSAPGQESRRRIWAQSFARIPSTEIDIDLDWALPELAKEKYNGREISNMVNTACTLARYEEMPLTMSHINSVKGVWQDFELGLSRLRPSSFGKSFSMHQGDERLPMRQGSILTEEPDSFT